ncbi:M15 family metallopeptidase [Ruminococcus sp.]|uniref:M15 family metallopeptidase n=1 Tax=Ruminococcus sp. TaxID=41978 RepID=UPI0025EB4653|nr:M15 family metallopeptidase [Ruminococcus sp.]MBQ8967580.1 M15 family metallopeptidase [Ruminococcus sp.]
MKNEVIMLREGFSASPVPAEIRERMKGKTYRVNDDIDLDDLSYLNVRYLDFSHSIADGELIVHKSLAKEVLEIFEMLFEAEYEIEKIKLCDEYDGDDEASMSDNNSSAFNFRNVAGTQELSLHALGRAIDINPLYNPYIVGEKVSPANGTPYVDRTLDFPHKINHHDLAYKVFASKGWLWGGDWTNSKDYQHFYKPKGNPVKSAVDKLKKLVTD